MRLSGNELVHIHPIFPHQFYFWFSGRRDLVIYISWTCTSISGCYHIPDGLAGSPDLQITDLLHLLLVLLAVVWLRVEIERSLGLFASLDRIVKIIEYRLQCILESATPVNSTASGSRRASLV